MQGMQEAQVMQNQEKSQVAVKEEEEVTGIQLLAREEADWPHQPTPTPFQSHT